MARKFGMGLFWGEILSRDFLLLLLLFFFFLGGGGLFEAQGIFLGFDFYPHLIIPV